MHTVSMSQMNKLKSTVAALDQTFEEWKPHLREVAMYFLPRRYQWLSDSGKSNGGGGIGTVSNSSKRNQMARNTAIIDPYGTVALRSLAAGLLNGITSPARPWFGLRLTAFDKETKPEPVAVIRWRQEVLRRMFLVLAGSNFYNAMAVQFLDLVCFGSSAFIIYEDFDEVIRCYVLPMGEYRFGQDNRRMITTLSRSFSLTVEQMHDEFGFENLSIEVQRLYNKGGGSRKLHRVLNHIIEPNRDDEYELGTKFKYREIYYEQGTKQNKLLRVAGFLQKPMVTGRWEVLGNDDYGTSPAMDALPKVIELQQVLLEKGRALAFMNRPPIVADSIFQTDPSSLLPGGRMFVTQAANFGAKAIYTVTPPIAEMRQDIQEIHSDIDAILHNDLFRMISNLSTVRSATEIDARREEKLVQLAAVLERFENEVLDPAIGRIYAIMDRKGLLPEPPPELEQTEIEVEYVSILSDAQRSVGTASLERFLQMVAQTGSVWPELLKVPDASELLRNYADRLNVDATGLRSREDVARQTEQEQELQQTREAALVGKDLTGAAENLSNTDVGGGRNALAALLGG